MQLKNFILLLVTIAIITHHATAGEWGADPYKAEPVPASLGLNNFYKKYLEINGIPIVSSVRVPDTALLQARNIIRQMFALLRKDSVAAEMIRHHVHIVVIAQNEVTTDIPEYSDLNTMYPQTNWNTRARGLGATVQRPVVSCGEENLLCYADDRYKGECILVHEFAHTIHLMALHYLEPDFDTQLESLYQHAKAKGLWKNTYAISNAEEYWAEGVLDFFDANVESIPCNGIHNQINTRIELQSYDPDLYRFISRYFIDDSNRIEFCR